MSFSFQFVRLFFAYILYLCTIFLLLCLYIFYVFLFSICNTVAHSSMRAKLEREILNEGGGDWFLGWGFLRVCLLLWASVLIQHFFSWHSHRIGHACVFQQKNNLYFVLRLDMKHWQIMTTDRLEVLSESSSTLEASKGSSTFESSTSNFGLTSSSSSSLTSNLSTSAFHAVAPKQKIFSTGKNWKQEHS